MNKQAAYQRVETVLKLKMMGWAVVAIAGIVVGIVTALPLIGAGVPMLAGAMVFNAIWDARDQVITIRHS